MRIIIVGSGVLGLASGTGLAALGHEVVYCDILSSQRERLVAAGLHVVKSPADAGACDVYMVCVPTPAGDDGFDLNSLCLAAQDVSCQLATAKSATVVVRSTVLPGTIRGTVLPILESGSGLRVGEGFGLCYNPEFLRAACALDDFLHPPITVLGEFDARSAELLADMYAVLGAPVLRTTPENAEAIKCFSNVYNATKVSFFNLLYLTGMQVGFDPAVVAQGMTAAALGLRLPEYYTHGGRPYGGTCLPKDLAATTDLLVRAGIDSSLLQAVAKVNQAMGGES